MIVEFDPDNPVAVLIPGVVMSITASEGAPPEPPSTTGFPMRFLQPRTE